MCLRLRLSASAIHCFILFVALFSSPVSVFAFSIFTVGPTADCPFNLVDSDNPIQDAVDAAANTPGVDYVWISNDMDSGTRHNYTGQHIHVNDPDGVIIEGGFVSCSDPNIGDNETTTISGAGNDGGPVFDIASGGGDVFLGNLFITGADRGANSYGGGISFNGTVAGALILRNATVSLNHAAFGAGIDVEGYTAAAALVIEQNTLILNNSASQSGGGIRIAGNTRLFATDPQIWIGFNHADSGDGGGINVVGPARADIGSPGYNGIGVLSSNTAKYGGAVSLYSAPPPNPSDFSIAEARFFSVDGSHPVQISNNSASTAGGAFVMFSNTHDCGAANCLDEANVCLFDARVNDNIAPNGSVAYGYSAPGIERLSVNQGGNCGPEAPTALGAQACQAGVACDEMNDNINEDDIGNPTGGSMVEMTSDDSLIAAERLHVQRNTGAHAFSMSQSNAYFDQSFTLRDALVADNQWSGEVMSLTTADGGSTIDRCTIAGNSIGTGYVLLIDGAAATLTNTIIDQPGHSTLDFNSSSSNNLTANYVLATEILELGTRTGVMQGEPTFVDAANSDYHLKYGSLGIDFAPAGTGSDLDRQPRTVDMVLVNDLFGPMDIGAYELQRAPPCIASDTIFCNGFE
jgi:hypothetical protein